MHFLMMEITVRTTLNLDDALLAKAKLLAAQERTSLTRLIERLSKVWRSAYARHHYPTIFNNARLCLSMLEEVDYKRL